MSLTDGDSQRYYVLRHRANAEEATPITAYVRMCDICRRRRSQGRIEWSSSLDDELHVAAIARRGSRRSRSGPPRTRVVAPPDRLKFGSARRSCCYDATRSDGPRCSAARRGPVTSARRGPCSIPFRCAYLRTKLAGGCADWHTNAVRVAAISCDKPLLPHKVSGARSSRTSLRHSRNARADR